MAVTATCQLLFLSSFSSGRSKPRRAAELELAGRRRMPVAELEVAWSQARWGPRSPAPSAPTRDGAHPRRLLRPRAELARAAAAELDGSGSGWGLPGAELAAPPQRSLMAPAGGRRGPSSPRRRLGARRRRSWPRAEPPSLAVAARLSAALLLPRPRAYQ